MIGNKILQGSSDDTTKPRLHNDFSVLEDELKPECDVLNNLSKKINNLRLNLDKLTEENQGVVDTLKDVRNELNGKQTKEYFVYS